MSARRVPVIAVLCLLVAACSSTTRVVSSTDVPDTGPVATDAVPAPSTTTTAPSASTTTLPDTAVPTTTLPVVPAGWQAVDPESVPSLAFPPCCASNWFGVPSPPLAAPGAPLTDGVYAAVSGWPDDPAGPLQLTLRRFELCSLLPEFACEDEGGSFSADSLGIDDSVQYPLTIPLDDKVRVVLVGFAGWESALSTISEGNGADIAELATALDLAYDEVIARQFLMGFSPEQIVADLYSSPTAGFGPVPEFTPEMMAISYTYDGAPPLLIQSVFRYGDTGPELGRGTDVLFIPSVEVVSGLVTVYIYAGYYP